MFGWVTLLYIYIYVMNWVAPPGDVFERTLSLPTESATSQLVLSSNVRASLAQSNGCPQPQVAHRNGCKELLKPTHHRHHWLPEPQILQDIRCYWTWLEIGFDGSLQVKGHVEMSSFTYPTIQNFKGSELISSLVALSHFKRFLADALFFKTSWMSCKQYLP